MKYYIGVLVGMLFLSLPVKSAEQSDVVVVEMCGFQLVPFEVSVPYDSAMSIVGLKKAVEVRTGYDADSLFMMTQKKLSKVLVSGVETQRLEKDKTCGYYKLSSKVCVSKHMRVLCYPANKN